MSLVTLMISGLMVTLSPILFPVCLLGWVCSLTSEFYLSEVQLLSSFFGLSSGGTLSYYLSLLSVIIFIFTFPLTLKDKTSSFSVLSIYILSLVVVSFFQTSKLFLLYSMFELSLFPTMLLILGDGYQPERIKASKFFLVYTGFASLPLLLVLIGVLKNFLGMNINNLVLMSFSSENLWTFSMYSLMIAFLVKLPIYGMHHWLLRAHVEAPVYGSMILAAILLKFGGYGIILVSPFTLSSVASSWLGEWCLTGGLFMTFLCSVQSDLKVLIAYSSVAHMSFIVYLSMISSSFSVVCTVALMVSHGFSSSMMFMVSFFVYQENLSRSLILTNNLLTYQPMMMYMFFLGVMGMTACPPSFNFFAEILTILDILSNSSHLLFKICFFSTFFTFIYGLVLFVSVAHSQASKSAGVKMQSKTMNLILSLMHLILIYLGTVIVSVI